MIAADVDLLSPGWSVLRGTMHRAVAVAHLELWRLGQAIVWNYVHQGWAASCFHKNGGTVLSLCLLYIQYVVFKA